ncbi:MAG: hypothetical protein L0206_11180, partial [Actinobacteria bacterium]|nr:hypothetical protein [Actinomycetota bacterium]
IVAAIVATSPSGATYRLPPGTMLQVFSPTYNETFLLDGDDTLVTIEVPAGEVFANLIHPSGYTNMWPLERTLGVDTDGIFARLVTEMPVPLTVPTGASVPLVLTFRVAGGTIRFAQGNIDVSVDVEEVGATSGQVSVFADLVVNSAIFGPDLPASLAASLPEDGKEVQLSLGGGLTGPWVQRTSTMICADISIAAGKPGFHEGFESLMIETFGEVGSLGSAELCVRDGPGIVVPLAHIFGFRVGAPTTSLFADATSEELVFAAALSAELPESFFDGDTLDLTQFHGRFPVMTHIATSVRPNVAGASDWYSSFPEGPGELTFVPIE